MSLQSKTADSRLNLAANLADATMNSFNREQFSVALLAYKVDQYGNLVPVIASKENPKVLANLLEHSIKQLKIDNPEFF